MRSRMHLGVDLLDSSTNDGVQEPAEPADDYYYPDGAYYFHGDPRRPGVVRRLPGRRPAPFDPVVVVSLAFLRKTCLLTSILRYCCFC